MASKKRPRLPSKKTLAVIVEEMPEARPRPLLKDTSRLIAVAAFIFSVTTGLFAAYQTYKNDRRVTIETVSRLIDQYYADQQKLIKLNPATESGFIALLQSQLRSTASRAAVLAQQVRSDVDEGIWLSLAQINDAENNLTTAEMAWNTAIRNITEARLYSFAVRGLAANQIRQGKLEEGNKKFQAAVDASLSDTIKEAGIKNPLPKPYRLVDAAATHIYWLGQLNSTECSIIVPHFDRALELVGQAERSGGLQDLVLRNQIVTIRSNLYALLKIRQACSAPNASIGTLNDICFRVANIVDAAPAGFAIFKASDLGDGEFRSRVDFPESERCTIDYSFNSSSQFSCVWPENTESAVDARVDKLVKTLLACSNLAPVNKVNDQLETTSRSIKIIKLLPEKRAGISIKKIFWKSSNRRPNGRWQMELEVEGVPSK